MATSQFTLMHRYDPAERVNRWYSVRGQPTLLDPIAVICAWGSRETSWQQSKIISADSLEQARRAAAAVVSSKIKLSYHVVESWTL